MKTSILAAAIIAALSVPIASAQDKPAPAKAAMEMGKPAQEPSASGKSMTSMDADKQGAKTQANMEKMQQQMDKIATTTEPKERQKLMQEHMQTMQENMKAMRSMDSPNMKCGMAMGDKKGGMPNCDMEKRQDMGEKRMDMMQDMMEQMMQRDKASKPMGDM